MPLDCEGAIAADNPQGIFFLVKRNAENELKVQQIVYRCASLGEDHLLEGHL